MENKFEKKLIEEIKREKKSFSLSSDEKSLLKERLLRYAKENPQQPVFESFKFSLYNRVLIPALSLVLIFGGVGISAAAEGSLPGDLLYPIKVSVNEVFREAFALSDKARQEWKIRQIERRFEEVAFLEERGLVDNRKEEVIKERLAVHVESLDKIAEKFDRKGELDRAEEVYRELETVFEEETEEKVTAIESASLRTESRDSMIRVNAPQKRVLNDHLSLRKEEAKIKALVQKARKEIDDPKHLEEIDKRLKKLREAIKKEDVGEFRKIIRELNSLLNR